MIQQNKEFRDKNFKPKGGYQNNRKVFDQNVKEYLPIISKLLDLEKISNSDLKQGIEKIENAIIEMKNEGMDERVKMHQIRNIFSLLKSADNINDLTLMTPRLKYIGARQRGNSGRFIADLIVELISKIDDGSNIKNLVYIVESIIAYHKFHINDKS